MHDFTPLSAAIGGALIASSLAVMLLATGRIAGLSNVFAGIVRPERGDWAWRAWFVVGALAIGLAFELAAPGTFDRESPRSLPVIALAGALVGFGTRLANGCTSGHGLCGTSRLAARSIVATVVFFGVGVAVATIAGAIARHA
jgi:uncharacterized membrane protein YedE/YeeE